MPSAAKLAQQALPKSLQEPARRAATAVLAGRSRQKAAALGGDVRLHIGSGFLPLDGWVNLDMVGPPVDLAWDLRRGLPFADGALTAVFSEHLFEHLPFEAGVAVVSESVRALRSGGVFRVAVPDAGLLLRSYAGTDDPEWACSREHAMEAVNALFYEHGHTTMYDEELLVHLCRLGGLTDVRACRFGDSLIDPAPDTTGRRDGTIYAEGVR